MQGVAHAYVPKVISVSFNNWIQVILLWDKVLAVLGALTDLTWILFVCQIDFFLNKACLSMFNSLI